MCSIYIQHTSGVHYDVVLDVNSGISHSSFMYKDIKDIHDVGMTKKSPQKQSLKQSQCSNNSAFSIKKHT